MIDLVDLKKWKKQSEILDELYTKYNVNISARAWRNQVKKWNKRWELGEVDYCVTHSNQLGFKATTDLKEAMIAVNDFRSRRNEMYKNEKAILGGFVSKMNLKIDFEKGEIK